VSSKEKLISVPNFPIEHIYKPLFRRSLFTVGLITRYFDFKEPEVYGEGPPAGE
jgi:cohesin loading factor subunit SCC2